MEAAQLRSRFIIIFVIVGLLAWSYFDAGIRLGQDLKGGTTLRFSLDIEGAIAAGRLPTDADETEVVTRTIAIIDERINKFGLAETNLTPVGDNKFEISLPAGSAGQVQSIVDIVTALGDLQFRVEVKPQDQYSPGQDNEYARVRQRSQVWPRSAEEFEAFRRQEFERWKEAQEQNRTYVPSEAGYAIAPNRNTPMTAPEHFHVLEVPADPNEQFDGGILENPTSGFTPQHGTTVNFDIKNEYRGVFGDWTEANRGLPMAIVLNGEYVSAPYIRERLDSSVMVQLGRGPEVEKEAETLLKVLETGSLKIAPVLEAKNQVGASLAGESRDRGILAILVAFGLVLAFMVVFYGAPGIVANLALLLNLLMLVGFLAFFQAVLTLPGIAGIVLTVGMAVDANILINERIKEERMAGRSVARALSEGYDRAMSAIIDANVTSLITAIFLYSHGSGPIKGFAVTLSLGLLVSMFTAIYVTRTVFETLSRKGLLKNTWDPKSAKLPRIKWLGLRRIFAPLSSVMVVLGIIIFALTDRYTIYDVDFTGGIKVQTAFTEPVSVDAVRDRLATERREITVRIKEYDQEDHLVERDHTVQLGPYPKAQVLEILGEDRDGVEIKVQRLFEGTDDQIQQQSRAVAFEEYVRAIFQDVLVPAWQVAPPQTYVHGAEGGLPQAPDASVDGGYHFALAFQDPQRVLGAELLADALREDFPYYRRQGDQRLRADPAEVGDLVRTVIATEREAPDAGARIFDVWFKSRQGENPSEEADAESLAKYVGEYLGGDAFPAYVAARLQPDATEPALPDLRLSEPFPSTDSISAAVAQRLKQDAIVALFFSLVGIIVYIAIRFRSRAMGFAAVLCLFHDVAITLGIVAIANQLGIVDAKINLAMVAAFLTLVGYSVNDTVVVFDRIRENRGNRKRVDAGIINLAINQTLARTIRTSVTFLLVCVALFAFNVGQRNVLEGFSFLLILGSIVGTYSTIAISAPLVMYLPWLWKRVGRHAPSAQIVQKPMESVATVLLVPIAALAWLVWAALFSAYAFVLGLVLFAPWALDEKNIQSTGGKESGGAESYA